MNGINIFFICVDKLFKINNSLFVFFSTITDEDDDDECSPDLLISKSLLSELVSEAAKLKSMSVMHQVSLRFLVLLFSISIILQIIRQIAILS